MDIIIGSARSDSRGKLTGDKAGDQKQKSNTNDTVGEVSMQKFYVHKLGWYILRPKTVELANKMAERMFTACNNPNLGYDQNEKLGVMKYGIDTKTPIETDCSTLERASVKEASGVDIVKYTANGNVTTSNLASALEKSGLFEKRVKYVSPSKTPLYTGDVLVTCTKGHTATVVSGNPRQIAAPSTPKYYPKYTGSSTSIVTALASVGEKDTSKTHRKKIAEANGTKNYTGTSAENTKMLNLLKKGKLIKA